MSDFGAPFLVIGMLAILAVDVFSVSYLKTALLDMRMRKPGFFLGSAGICVASIILSLIMAGAFLQSPVKAETTELPKAGTVQEETGKIEEAVEEPESEKPEEPKEPEVKEPELTQTTVVTPTTVTVPTASANVPAAPAAQTTSVVQVTVPTFDVWRGYYKNFTYNFIEITNGTPYVYMPTSRGNFQGDLNNIVNNREGGNIIVMANAGVYNTTTTEPLGTTIQNNKVLSRAESSDNLPRTLVVDETGNVGYTTNATSGQIASYTDAKTGKTVTGLKIVSAVYGFGPVVLNGKMATEYKDKIGSGYRARQMFCVKQNSYIIITNTGEGETGGGWNFDDMVQVANYRGCLSAFNLDGGGSTATAYRTALNKNFSILASTERHNPTFIVFTADNLAPRGK